MFRKATKTSFIAQSLHIIIRIDEQYGEELNKQTIGKFYCD